MSDRKDHLSRSIVRLITIAALTLGTVSCASRSRSAVYRDRSVWFIPSSACADSGAHPLPAVRPSDTLSAPTRWTLDPLRDAWLARRVPGGYAGGPMAGDRVALHLILRDTAQKRAALVALDTLWPRDDPSRELRFGVDSFVATPAHWDLAELYDWLQVLVANMPAPDGRNMNGWGIDVRRNRILVTVDSTSRLPALLVWLDRLQLPCRLVAIEVTGPFVLTSNPPPNKALLQTPQTR